MSRIHHTFVTVFVVVLSSATCFAQFGGGGGAGGGGFGGGQGGGQGGQGGQGNQGGFQAAGGITIDGNGVLSAPKAKTISPDVAKKRMQELAKQFLPEDLSRSSSLRKVSLVLLERAIAELQESDKPIP